MAFNEKMIDQELSCYHIMVGNIGVIRPISPLTINYSLATVKRSIIISKTHLKAKVLKKPKMNKTGRAKVAARNALTDGRANILIKNMCFCKSVCVMKYKIFKCVLYTEQA